MRAVVVRAVRLVVCLLVCVSPSVAAAQEQQAFLELVVNGVDKGEALVVLRDGDALVPAETLTEAGLTIARGGAERLNGREFVSLRTLSPAITFHVDEEALQLVLTAAPDLLGRTVYDFRTGPPQDVVYASATSAFVNYAVGTGTGGYGEIFTESGLSAGGALLYATMTTTSAGTVRGLTNATIDDRRRMRRWVVGDSFANTGALGSGSLVTGITVTREFSVEPYFVQFPSLSVTTPVATPSTLEVYVNDRLVREERVEPGLVDMRNLPLLTGHNQTRIVVRDPFGGARELTGHYYLTASALAPGLQDYQYSVGVERTGLGMRSFEFGGPVLIGRHRVGVTPSLTLGGRVEAERRLVSGGPSASVRLPAGELEAAVAVSRTSGADTFATARGTATRIAYLYSSRVLSGGVTATRMSRHYATLSLRAFDDRSELEGTAYVIVPLRTSGSLSLQHGRTLGSEAVAARQTSLTASWRVFGHADVSIAASHRRTPQRRDLEASAGLTIGLGRRTLASASIARSQSRSGGAFEVQRALPVTTGFGYQVRADTTAPKVVSAIGQYQGAYGLYDLRHDGGGSLLLRASGGLVAIGGSVHATRPIRNSYALVQVPGVADVRGFASHQEIGRTDRRGNLLITDLLPYYANEVSIADTDVPLTYNVGDVEMRLAPPYRGGAVARFQVERVQRTMGRVTVMTGAGEQAPAYGELSVRVGGRDVLSPVGAKGEFYFDSLPAGHHTAVVTHGGTTCRFAIDIPASDSDLIDLGEMRCVAAEEEPSR